jgi:3-oxoacyl-[acyl-carrier protein] reductase
MLVGKHSSAWYRYQYLPRLSITFLTSTSFGFSLSIVSTGSTEINSGGGQADFVPPMVPVSGVLLEAAQLGRRLDVLVSNAGISKSATIKDHTVEDSDNLFATNVRSPFFLVQQLLPLLGEGSNIIVISSVLARTVVGKPGLDNGFNPCLRRDQGSARDSR